MSSSVKNEQATSSPTQQKKPLKKHMTYILSETTTNPITNESTTKNECGDDYHHQHTLNRTSSLLAGEELLNEIKHTNNLMHNYNMSCHDKMNIIQAADRSELVLILVLILAYFAFIDSDWFVYCTNKLPQI